MTTPETNGNGHCARAAKTEDEPSANETAAAGGLVEEVTALRTVLRDAFDRTNRLLTLLRQQNKQSRLLSTTLASLRQLQEIG